MRRRIVALHGFTGGPESWDAVRDALGGGVDLACPPLLGHHPEHLEGDGGFEAEVDRLAAQIQDSTPVHLAGYSLGGRLALGLLVRHPRLSSGATLIGVRPGLVSAEERRRRAAADEALARRLEERGVRAFVDRWQELPLFASQKGLPAALLAAQRQRRLRHDAAGLAVSLRQLSPAGMPDVRPALAGLEMPVRCMAGRLDATFCRLGREMAAALPRGRFEAVPEAGHNLLLEAPRAVAAALQEGTSA